MIVPARTVGSPQSGFRSREEKCHEGETAARLGDNNERTASSLHVIRDFIQSVAPPLHWLRSGSCVRFLRARSTLEVDPDHQADRELVRAVLARDPGAVEALVQRLRCIPRILSLLNQRVGNALGAEDLNDLTQDTLARLWPRIERYNGQASLETWFYGFCFNGFMNVLRRGNRAQPVGSLTDQVASPDGPPLPLDYDHLHRGLEQLGEAETRVIRLKYFDDLTFDEIGQRLGISPNTVKTRYYRGMRKLEELLRRGREEVER